MKSIGQMGRQQDSFAFFPFSVLFRSIIHYRERDKDENKKNNKPESIAVVISG